MAYIMGSIVLAFYIGLAIAAIRKPSPRAPSTTGVIDKIATAFGLLIFLGLAVLAIAKFPYLILGLIVFPVLFLC